jgi:1-acyl-sn-glycerol-3-phosphate acyltransferase
VAFLAKHSLFVWPLGVVLRAFGGIPVDRRARHDIVEQMTRRFEASDSMLLALSPEGTRQHVDEWKTGFYHIARAADVPIVPAAIDFKGRMVRFGPPLHPAGDMDSEIPLLRAFFDDVVGKRPDLA